MTKRQIPSLERCPEKVDGVDLVKSLFEESRVEVFFCPELLTKKLVIEEFSRFFPIFLGLECSFEGEKEAEEFLRLSKGVEFSGMEESISEFWEEGGSDCFFLRLILGLSLVKEFSSMLFCWSEVEIFREIEFSVNFPKFLGSGVKPSGSVFSLGITAASEPLVEISMLIVFSKIFEKKPPRKKFLD